MGRMLQHFCLSLRVPTKETQRHSDVVQHDDGQACDSTQPALTELLRPSCEPTEVDERSAQENTTTPRDMVVQRRVRSVDDTDDYMIARARLLALSRRPTQHLNEINSSRSRSSGGKKGNTQVYSLQVRRAKCKNCQNVGHTPILQLHLLSSDPCVKGSTGTSRGRQQQHHVQCCVCNKIIASTQSFHGSTNHLDVRDLITKAVVQPRDHAQAQERKRMLPTAPLRPPGVLNVLEMHKVDMKNTI
mmetsp:Transcript_17622/g.33688  ORF Transcript_17622/g.33688 Transcript_17622/m.33688 type:complete len:245 (-) Transcript_17622:197-931(-)